MNVNNIMSSKDLDKIKLEIENSYDFESKNFPFIFK